MSGLLVLFVDLAVESAKIDEPVVSDGNWDAHARFIVGRRSLGDANFESHLF
jgi:hypothetical protein